MKQRKFGRRTSVFHKQMLVQNCQKYLACLATQEKIVRPQTDILNLSLRTQIDNYFLMHFSRTQVQLDHSNIYEMNLLLLLFVHIVS